MRIYVDTVTGTWGYAEDIVAFETAMDEWKIDGLSDGQRIYWATQAVKLGHAEEVER